ncbi:MAG: carbon-nitrogen hydrolase family protein [Clostridia bacterium]|nr:carbon-nitrogen hydrolase family protein [Clostridia bacterium]
MKIALCQMKMEQDIEINYRKTLKAIKEAAMQKADLILFPEIQFSPFFPQYENFDARNYLLTPDSPYVLGVCECCRENGIFASPNFYIEENGRRYDMSLLIDENGKIVGKQKMVHVAQCENFYEQSYYTPSEEGFSVFDTKFGKIGIVVCFDRHYPESIRTQALCGAELILIPTANVISEPCELFRWEIRVQAFQNSVHIAMCNRVGKEGNMVFSGESLVSDCFGNVQSFAGSGEELLFAEIDLKTASDARKEKPYTSLRRKEFYK